MEPESSSPYSQVPTICPYPEPTPSSLYPLPLPGGATPKNYTVAYNRVYMRETDYS